MKKIILIASFLVSASSAFAFFPTTVTKLGEAVPAVMIEAATQEKCEAKLNSLKDQLSKKRNAVILSEKSCKLTESKFQPEIYSGAIMFY